MTDEKIKLDVITRAYGWTISTEGEVAGLIAGDMGYEGTGIKIPLDHLSAVLHDDHEKIEDTLAFRAGYATAVDKIARRLAGAAWRHRRAGDETSYLAIFGELEKIWELPAGE